MAGDIELIRRVYVVFQDLNWTARPWLIEDERIDGGPDWFDIALRARGTFDARDFTWQGTLTGQRDGTITFDFRGSTDSAFPRNRLGLCILHPPSVSGQPAIVEHVDGTVESTAFPDAISPHQPFVDMRALTHEPRPGLHCTIRMSGEVFESEDHRNWSDASFKHYCTPISLPFPVQVLPGQPIEQSVTVTCSGKVRDVLIEDEVRIRISDERRDLPGIGLQLDTDGHRLDVHEIGLLRDLGLAHVRIDLGGSDGPEQLEAALQDASAVRAPAVVALIGTDPSALASFVDDTRIDHWLVFDPATKVTDPALVERVREILGADVGGGTNLYFTELNRGRPTGPQIISFSINPQVHATDDQTVMQNAMTFGSIAQNARDLYPDARLEISPITLRPRFNPNATAPELDHSNTALPSRVDVRQCQPFAAAWTVLTLKAIGESGCIDSVTYYRATGWEGMIERAEGSPQPTDFPSRPGEPFPLYWIFRELAAERRIRVCTSSDPSRVDALALDNGIVLLANLTSQPQQARVEDQQMLVPPHGVARVILRPDGSL